MVHGEWATQFAHIGIYCGKSKIGCPVKIERLGKYDLAGLQASRRLEQPCAACYALMASPDLTLTKLPEASLTWHMMAD